MKTASLTIKGIEVVRMIRRGHCLTGKPHVMDEVRFINKLFDIFAVATCLKQQPARLPPIELMQQRSSE